MKPAFRLPLLALALTLVVTAALALLTQLGTGATWEDMPLGNAGRWAEYCERNRFQDLIRQPVNAWSNLFYLWLGFWVLLVARQDAQLPSGPNPLIRFPLYSAWIGLMLVGLCGGSFFYHASVTAVGQHWDMTFTYGIAMGLAIGGGYRWAVAWGLRETRRAQLLTLALALATTILIHAFKWMLNGKIALPVMMLAGVALALTRYLAARRSYDGRWLLAGVLTLAAAGVFRSLDLAKVACNPDGFLQWHAGWHILTGVAAFCFWVMLHREKP